MERKIFTVTTIICLITFLGIIAGVSAETIDIEGPWLWMIAPVPFNQGGAASIQLDSLAEMSCGVVTEQMIATNGAKAGDPVGNYQWTPGEISVERPGWLDLGDGNINDTLNAIGMITGNVNHATAYALINIESSAAQAATIKVGSDDAIKVWLNGVVVHTNAINRSTTDYQDAFGVNLNAGDNLLMVKVSEQERKWRMFVGLDVPNPNTLGFHIPQRKVPIVGNVTFSNLDLANGVRQALSLPAGADIPKAQLATLTELSVPGAGIANLTGLEHATQLEVLDLSDNQIDDLSPLTGLINLTELDLSDNEITDVSPLTGLTRLRNLHLNNNLIKDSNMIPLGDLINLTLHFDAAYQTTNADGSTVYNYNNGTGNETVLIKGLELQGWDSKVMDNTEPAYLPDENGKHFQIYEQVGDTCGIYSAMMLLHYYGVKFANPKLGEQTFGELSAFLHPVNLAAPGTTPDEMERGLKKSFPVAIEHIAVNPDNNDPSDVLRDMISQNRPPILFTRQQDYYYHWVIAVGYDTMTDRFLIADPNGFFYWSDYSKWTDTKRSDGNSICRPPLKDGWRLDPDEPPPGCNLDSRAWAKYIVGEFVEWSQIPYQMLVPEEAPPYHHLESETFHIIEEGDPKKNINTDSNLNKAFEFEKVVHCAWFFVKNNRADVRVNWDINKVVVSGTIGNGEWNLPGPWNVTPGTVDMFLTVYFEKGPAPPLPAPAMLSVPSINTVLLPNYPNPFNPETWLPYQLSEPAEVKLTIYDIQGRVVRALDLGHQRAGMYHSRSRAAHWDGRNAVGEPVASGIYFYTLKAGDFFATRKMLIRK